MNDLKEYVEKKSVCESKYSNNILNSVKLFQPKADLHAH